MERQQLYLVPICMWTDRNLLRCNRLLHSCGVFSLLHYGSDFCYILFHCGVSFSNMIIDAISTIALNIITWIISLAPTMTSGDYANIQSITDAINAFINMINWASFFFPIKLAFTILSIVITIELSLFTIRVFRWIASIVTIGFVK